MGTPKPERGPVPPEKGVSWEQTAEDLGTRGQVGGPVPAPRRGVWLQCG